MKHITSHESHTVDQLGEEPTIHPTARIQDSDLGVYTQVGEAVQMTESRFDDYSYIVRFGSTAHTEVGKFCSIAAFVRLNPGNHPMERATQHHMTYRRHQYAFADEDGTEMFKRRRNQPVVLGHDVWIGHGATVMPDVTIGTGAVVAAGAVVTHDVEPYAVVAGVPAERIRWRVPPAVAAQLQEIAWWHWSREELEQAFADLCGDAVEFVTEYGSGPVSQSETAVSQSVETDR